MKIRSGFVSNSSSTSFIVALPKNINSPQALKELLFPYEETINGYSTLDISKRIWEEKNQTLQHKNIEDLALSVYFAIYGHDDLDQFEENMRLRDVDDDYDYSYDHEYDKFMDECKKTGHKYVGSFLAAQSKRRFGEGNYDIYVFEFHDENDFEYTIEKGDVFANVPKIAISNH